MNSEMTKHLISSQRLTDIRFWIIIFFVARLYAITNPPLEVGHNWRQTDGLMIARNFYERSANIFYPRVDVGGERTGIVGCEFPILNYLVYLMALVFGYDHWYGRLIVLIVSSFGVFFFHKVIRRYFGESPAFNSAILLMGSFWFSYSRKIIPDVFALSLCIISLYYALAYLESGKWSRLFLFFLLGALGCLSKILAASILTVLLVPLFDKEIPLVRKGVLSLFSFFILILVCGWYFAWVPYLNETYGFGDHFFMGLTFEEGFKRISDNIPLMSKRFYDTAMKYTGFAAFLFAIVISIRKKAWIALVIFLPPFLAFLFMLIKTGSSMIGDTYYILTFVPSMAFITGYGLAQIPNRKVVAFILLVVVVENVSAQIYDFRIRQPYRSLASLESIMDSVSAPQDLVIINSSTNEPTAMYFAHRRGWVAPNTMLQDETFLKDIINKGCKVAVIAKKLHGDTDLKFPIVHESEYFRVYRLNE